MQRWTGNGPRPIFCWNTWLTEGRQNNRSTVVGKDRTILRRLARVICQNLSAAPG